MAQNVNPDHPHSSNRAKQNDEAPNIKDNHAVSKRSVEFRFWRMPNLTDIIAFLSGVHYFNSGNQSSHVLLWSRDQNHVRHHQYINLIHGFEFQTAQRAHVSHDVIRKGYIGVSRRRQHISLDWHHQRAR